MLIQLQGEKRQTQASTVMDLLKELNLLPSQVAVEHNGSVVFRHELASTRLKENDRIEIVRVAAGG
ncbi:MAG: sulfur carrier protein ThiS [Verrucomicrobiae bacterium]|nr:sulfur carrier protein ThiS [Verrucomicrobiae bacterium]